MRILTQRADYTYRCFMGVVVPSAMGVSRFRLNDYGYLVNSLVFSRLREDNSYDNISENSPYSF